jgi:hypothetical protein
VHARVGVPGHVPPASQADGGSIPLTRSRRASTTILSENDMAGACRFWKDRFYRVTSKVFALRRLSKRFSTLPEPSVALE